MKKIIKWVGLGFLGLIILIAIISAFSGDNTSQPSNQANTPQTEQKTEYATGETINLKNHQLIVNAVTAPWASSNEFSKPQSSDNDFVLVNVTIINNGKSSLNVNSFGFKLEDENGVQRNATIAVADNLLETSELSAGGKVTGNLVFEAKTGSKSLKLLYGPGFMGGSEVTVKLK